MPPFNHAFGLLAEGDLGTDRLGIAPNSTACPKGLAPLVLLGGDGFALISGRIALA